MQQLNMAKLTNIQQLILDIIYQQNNAAASKNSLSTNSNSRSVITSWLKNHNHKKCWIVKMALYQQSHLNFRKKPFIRLKEH